MRKSNSILIPMALMLVLAACGKDKSPEQQRKEAVAEIQATADRLKNISSDPDKAAAELQALSREMEQRAARAQAEQREPAADVCAFLDAADIKALVGANAKREPMQRMGSSWGGCDYGPAEVTMENIGKARYLMVNIRPADEFEATVAYQGQGGALTEVPELAGKAYLDGKSLLWQPPGKPWFVFVAGGPLGKQDPGFALEAAKRMEL